MTFRLNVLQRGSRFGGSDRSRSRTWSCSFAGCRALRHTQGSCGQSRRDQPKYSAPPRSRTSSDSFEDCRASVTLAERYHKMYKSVRGESNPPPRLSQSRMPTTTTQTPRSDTSNWPERDSNSQCPQARWFEHRVFTYYTIRPMDFSCGLW